MKNNHQKTVLELFRYLLLEEISKKELIEILKIKETTFHKYIQKIKSAGFLVTRKKDLYKIVIFQNKTTYQKREIMALSYFHFLAKSHLSKNKLKQFEEIIKNVLYNSNYKTYQDFLQECEKIDDSIYKKPSKSKINEFQRYIDTKQKLKITLKQNIVKTILPIEITWKKDILNIKAIDNDNNSIETYRIKDILNYKPIQENEFFVGNVSETIFEITGRLAPIYILKENERIIDRLKNKIVIANSENNKNNLFKRLLRYDINCKVLFPKQDVENYKKFIQKAIENLSK